MRYQWNNDAFTKKARKENYEARSVYKLEEIEKREKIFRGAHTILDLGAAPGSWTQFALQRLPVTGKIIAIDLEPLKVNHPRLQSIVSSIETVDFNALLAGAKVDLVLSDMAPKTSGIHDLDVMLSLELANLALDVARAHLKKNGNFVTKLFMGDGFEEFHKTMKSEFKEVRLLRPESTRKHSREIFFVGKGLLKEAQPLPE